jgi:hypothetical protein
LSFAADAAAGLGLDPEFVRYRYSISSSAKESTVTIASNVKLDNVEVLESFNGYDLSSQTISLIFESMGHYKIVILSIDP